MKDWVSGLTWLYERDWSKLDRRAIVRYPVSPHGNILSGSQTVSGQKLFRNLFVVLLCEHDLSLKWWDIKIWPTIVSSLSFNLRIKQSRAQSHRSDKWANRYSARIMSVLYTRNMTIVPFHAKKWIFCSLPNRNLSRVENLTAVANREKKRWHQIRTNEANGNFCKAPFILFTW